MILTLILIALVGVLILLAALIIAISVAFDKVDAAIADLAGETPEEGELVDSEATVWSPEGVDDTGRTLYGALDGTFSGWRREDVDRVYGVVYG